MKGYRNVTNLALIASGDMEEWRDQALCARVDPNLHFPDKYGWRGQVAAAKRICQACPSLAPCREWAIAADEPYGIAGGLTPRDRDRLAGRRGPLESARSRRGEAA